MLIFHKLIKRHLLLHKLANHKHTTRVIAHIRCVSYFPLVFHTLLRPYAKAHTRFLPLPKTPTCAPHSNIFKINAHARRQVCMHSHKEMLFIHSASFQLQKKKGDVRRDRTLEMTALPFLSTSLSHS